MLPICRPVWEIALLLAALAAPGVLSAQELSLSDQAEEAHAAEKPDEQAKPIREQTIYIPYTRLRDVFEKEGRGVFLPYEKFQALWKAAKQRQVVQPEKRPPVSALVTAIESEAQVGKDVVRVSAKLNIEVLAEGWNEVPLGLSDTAIQSAKVDDKPARLTFDAASGYKLLVKNEGKEPRQVVLSLEYAKSFTKAPGQNSVAFQAPQAPVNRWRIRIPDEGVKVNVHPLLAATEVPSSKVAANADPFDDPGLKESGQQEEPDENDEEPETVVLAFVGASPTVRIEWTPKAEGATGLEALATVQAQQETTIDEGVLRTRARLTYDITRAEVSQLKIEVSSDQKVVNVFDPNVRQWEVDVSENAQTVSVQLFQPTRGTQNLTVELEKFRADEAQQSVSVPMVKALEVGRQQGLVLVQLSEGLRGEVEKRSGLLQVDASELPKTLAGGKWSFAYRYSALPFELTLEVEKVQPSVTADELVEAYLEPQQLTIDLLALYTIERAGVFQLELMIPDGFELRQVRGQAAAGAEAAAVDAHHLEGEMDRRLIVNLSRKALGRIGLLVELQRRLDEPNLLTPSGETSEIAIALPRVAADSVQRTSGRLVVYVPESLRANPSEQQGLTNVSFVEALQGTESVRGNRFAELRPVLSYAFTQTPANLELSVQRRKPYITAAQLLVAQIDAGVVKYQATFFYDIRYSGVKSLRIDVPESLADEIRNQTPGLREKRIDPQPDDVAAGQVAWSFTGDTELAGNPIIQLTWEQKLDKLEVGKSVRLDLPKLRPQGADRAWGQIVLAKSETIDLAPATEPQGLRPIDPQHDLMPGASVPNAARAFEFQDDWSLALEATRYKLEDVKTTSIERGVIRMVATRSDQLAVQALYRIRSAVQRLAVQLPTDAQFDTQPLRINGRPASLERGDQNELFVPLVGQSPDEPFLLELRYTIAQRSLRFDVPEFPGAGGQADQRPAVQKIYLCAYVPEEQTLLGAGGPWNDELLWRDGRWLRDRPQPRQSDTQLVSWVQEGLNVASTTDTFQTDGQMYLFSTLAPEPPPDGSLKLFTLDEDWFRSLIFLSLLMLGLVMVRRPIAQKLAAVALAVIVVVLIGAYWPIFSRQVMDSALVAAVVIVGMVWLVWHLLIARPAWFDHLFATRDVSYASAPMATTAGGESPFADSEAAQSAEPPAAEEKPQEDRQGGGDHA
jgi:hypothetical protein